MVRLASIGRYGDRTSRSFPWAVLFISLLSFSPIASAETASNTELEGILQKIESRHYRWIAIRADVLLFFAKAEDANAMCGGELLYQRLDERIFLTCVDNRQELMFAFRTLDRRFDLYLPGQNTVYHGSIFDLEDSPDIESHLKARDLYRALKPLAVDPRRAKIDRNNSLVTSLDVYNKPLDNAGATLARKLYLSPEGDVRGELFYNSSGRPVTEIQRYDFREFRGPAGAYDSILFPKKITITSPETKKGSAIFFTRVTALDTIDPLDFILRVPPGTKEVFLDEKDPRFQRSKTSESTAPPLLKRPEAHPIPLAADFEATPLPEKPKARVIERAPAPSPSKKSATAPQIKTEKKSAEEPPQPPSPEKKTPAKSEEPQSEPEKPSEKPAPAEDADADIAVEDKTPEEPSSSTDAQTTLDPSVSPSLDMEKQ